MFKKIFKKEYIKLRYVLLGLLLMNSGLVVKMWLSMRAAFKLNPSINVWLDLIEKNSLYFGGVTGVLELSGLIIGILQFLPEVDKKRFRISCHLPLNESGMIFSMVLSGIFFLTALWIIDTLAVYAVGVVYFPREIYTAALSLMCVSQLKTIIAYIFGVVITLEPQKMRKAVLIAIFFPMLTLFAADGYRSYEGEMLPFIIITLMMIPVVLNPAYRFRKGDF